MKKSGGFVSFQDKYLLNVKAKLNGASVVLTGIHGLVLHLDQGCVNPDSSKSVTATAVIIDLSLNHTAL